MNWCHCNCALHFYLLPSNNSFNNEGSLFNLLRQPQKLFSPTVRIPKKLLLPKELQKLVRWTT